MFRFYAGYLDGSVSEIDFEMKSTETANVYRISDTLSYQKISYIDVILHDFPIQQGDEGYYVLPGGNGTCIIRECGLGRFTNREDGSLTVKDAFMPIFGLNHPQGAFLAAVTGMKENVRQVVQVENGQYTLTLRVIVDGDMPYETVEIHEFYLPEEDHSYNAMARVYRKYQLEHGFVSMKDRNNPDLNYAAESILIRVRMGWKPVPCQVIEQTLENEPPMHVACTFADVEKIIHAYQKIGVKKAEISLVGWNVRGHDGRWPQILPVEEALGGEEGLKHLIQTAKEAGYAITCHTNSTDAYSIAENFDEKDIALQKDGQKSVEAIRWAGGKTYNLCPKRAYEISTQTLPPVAKLGFRGMHYIDVITCTAPRYCNSPLHPVNRKEAGIYFDKLFAMSRELFGGASCEGPYEFSQKNIDFVLYTSFLRDRKPTNFLDEYIPFWQLIYHGITMSNPYSCTINPVISSDPDNLLRLVEYGGRPVHYYYCQFVSDGTNWIGDQDFTTDSPEAIQFSAEATKKMMDIYEELSYLQYEFMEEHTCFGDGVYKVTYSDGSVITVDYNQKSYHLEKAN